MSKIQSKQELPLSSLISIRQNGVRSVNIEQDLRNMSIAENYILTAQSRECLGRIIRGMNGQTPVRAYTLTGPYGSGKSFFGLFLMNLLSASQSAHHSVFELLNRKDFILADQITGTAHLTETRGLLAVPVAGFRAPIYECLRHGFKEALLQFCDYPRLLPLLENLEAWSSATDSRAIIRCIQSLLEVIRTSPFNFSGLILVFDEMGKSLEFSALHPDDADVYLLQEIAEFANRSGDSPFLFIGILHQSFERYAALLDNTTQREWSKVQGRFADIPFQEPPSQQMWLIANALQFTEPKAMSEVKEMLHGYAQNVVEHGWCPPMTKPEDFVDLCTRAYPLHPTALVTLPFIFRRLAQNERSIFAYLASLEPYGLQEFLQQNHLPAQVRLSDLFDYLSANFQGRLYASGRARALTEAIERLTNSIRLNAAETKVLKTISLLNWLGEVSHLKATEEALMEALKEPEFGEATIKQTLRSLQSHSLIVFRRFNGTYTIWQGSDVDLEERLDAARQHLTSAFSLADAVQRYLPPNPLVARRHSYQIGTLRYFEVRYVDNTTRGQISLAPAEGATGLVLLCLPANHAEIESFHSWAKEPEQANRRKIVFGIATRIARLAELMQELRCLYWVKENTPELRDDPVARRELRSRLSDIESLIRAELDRTISLNRLSDSMNCDWFYQGKIVETQAGAGLSHLLSQICDDLYDKTPRLWNELINRRTLSSQAAAARRNLIEAILTQSQQPGLGIKGYPPERSMYESLLLASGLHGKNDNQVWCIYDPPAENKLGFQPFWLAISDYVFQQPPQPLPVIELFRRLSDAPFGLTEGVLPIFLCAFTIAHQHEITLYREGTLLPEPGVPDWEVLLRRPELFLIAGCRVTGTRLILLERFARGYHTKPAVMPVVRELIQQVNRLPEHTLRTQQLSKKAIAVRSAVAKAYSPERFLFHDLPKAVGVKPFDENQLDPKHSDKFFAALNAALMELNDATPNLRRRARDEFLRAFGLQEGEQSWLEFLEIAAEMAPRVTHPGLIPLMKRANEAADERIALESVLAQVANRPLKSWSDADAERFSGQAQFLGNLFKAERDSGRLPPGPQLPMQQRIRSQEIAADIRRYLKENFADDPSTMQAALRLLLDDSSLITKL